ncbi:MULTISPECIES: peptidoglycan-binding protein [unclassified Variovorax]|uniref:peptidoglycan-binding protein n=1 Tax=unclassified Variovorax TaxID=663243 RepID=UPI0013179EF3|nr:MULTISPECIES: peptidoglycan-binding protein [unclassified Variovorax]VTU31915.1 hypothetical protein SRS16CHR_04980 [Variovorax sp. SRS16]VTU38884.1 hypothetical protein E5CHR_04936 [Variovorax sp. PBL-E5]
MAFSFKYIGSTSHVERVLYNLDWSVGRIGGNLREDVMLAQALLRMVFYELAGKGGLLPPLGADGIEVDGWIGPSTLRHIAQFQDQAISLGQKVLRDGNFDPFRKVGQSSTISHTRYSIELLNNFCANNCDTNRMRNFDDLPVRLDVPLQLRNALKTVKKTAAQYQ